MFLLDNLKVGNSNNLEIGGCDTVELTRQYGTPLYVIDEGRVRENCKKYVTAIKKYYNGNGLVIYAGKAFCNLYMCKLVKEEGLGLMQYRAESYIQH